MEKEFLLRELPFERLFDPKVRGIDLSIFNLIKYLNSHKDFEGFEFLEIKGGDSHFTLLYSKDSYIASSFIKVDNLILNQEALFYFQTFKKDSIINILSIYNTEIVNSILSLYYGEMTYKNLDYEILDVSKLFDILFENKFTGILSFSGDGKEYIFCNEGNGIILERGNIKESFPINEFIHHIPDSLIPLLSNPKTKLTTFSLRKDREIKPLKGDFVERVSEEIYINISEYIKRMAGSKGLKIFEKYFKPNTAKSVYLYNLNDFQREITKLVGKLLGESIINFVENQLDIK